MFGRIILRGAPLRFPASLGSASVLGLTLVCACTTWAGTALPFRGDLDDDGRHTVLDLVRLNAHIADTQPLPPQLRSFADLDGNGFYNQDDRLALLSLILETAEPTALPLATLRSSSPASGESGVALTRELIVHFTLPLAPNVTLTTSNFFAVFAGRTILSRVELATDRTHATLFFLEPLPASARLQATLHGESLTDLLGRPFDADGDGQPGGSRQIAFETLSITAVPGAGVRGRVFASELVAGGPLTNTTDLPLAGVQIRVDGAEESLFTQTDAQGAFVLSPCPIGRFFVSIDGRTVTNSPAGPTAFPAGPYYPFVGKAWDAAPGTTNLVNGDGIVYLPLIRPGTLQEVSASVDTLIPFPAAVTAANSNLLGVSITVPANALFSNDGTRGGRVGLSPVAPDRIPEPLPPGLDLPLVITVQTDGPSNFDRPVPARFPNLPDPITGVVLPPGAKSALWSFDHDVGRWVMQGPMTVTADGRFVETDRGVGIRQPGWHGPLPGTPPDPDDFDLVCTKREIPAGCAPTFLFAAFDCGISFVPLPIDELRTAEKCLANVIMNGRQALRDCAIGGDPSCIPTGGTLAAAATLLGCTEAGARLVPGADKIIACGAGAINSAIACFPVCVQFKVVPKSRGLDPGDPNPDFPAIAQAYDRLFTALRDLRTVTFGSPEWSRLDPALGSFQRRVQELAAIERGLRDAMLASSPDGPRFAPPERAALLSLPVPRGFDPALVAATIDHLDRSADLWNRGITRHAQAGQTNFVDATALLHANDNLEAAGRALIALGEVDFNFEAFRRRARENVLSRVSLPREALLPDHSVVVPGRTFFLLEEIATGLTFRGTVNPDGSLPVAALRPATDYRLHFMRLPNSASLAFDRGAHPPGSAFPLPELGGAIERFMVDSSGPGGLVSFRFLERVAIQRGGYGNILFESARSGEITRPPRVLLEPDDALPDADLDGLSDFAETVVGTLAALHDSDSDGINDFVELQNGTDPLDGPGAGPAQTGIIASTDTDGFAIDIAALNNLALLADTQSAVLFNVAGRNPIRLAQFSSAHPIRCVALGEQFGAFGDGNALAVLDLAQPAAPILMQRIPTPGRTDAIALAGELALVGTASGFLALLDLRTGEELQRVNLGPVIDLQLDGDRVFVLTQSFLHTAPFVAGELGAFASRNLSPAFFFNSPPPRRRINAGPGALFAVDISGFDAFTLADPASPLLAGPHFADGQAGWRQFIPIGTGRALACVGPNSGVDPARNVSLFQLGAPGSPPSLQVTFPTPGSAEAASLFNGFAYVADGNSGLQVLNPLPFDATGIPPTLDVTASFPLAPQAQATEGAALRLTAEASDNVQIRAVEFFLDDQRRSIDGGYPYEFRFTAPLLAQTNQFGVRIRATDTGGNAVVTNFVVQLLPDSTRPLVVRTRPAPGALLGFGNTSRRAGTAYFSEPIAAPTLTTNSIGYLFAGTDAVFATSDDRIIPPARILAREFGRVCTVEFDSDLGPGRYHFFVITNVADLAGNTLLSNHVAECRVASPLDTDGDNLPDDLEPLLGLDPNLADSDGDTIPDALEDFDGDALGNLFELLGGSDPTLADSDGDSIPDRLEDNDLDSLTAAQEFAAGTDPTNPDTDSDGWNDEAELTGAGDPLLAKVVPALFHRGAPETQVVLPRLQLESGVGPSFFAASQQPIAQLTHLDIATGDRDRDGISDAIESVAGTDPDNPASRPIGVFLAAPAPIANLPAAPDGATFGTNTFHVAQPNVRTLLNH